MSDFVDKTNAVIGGRVIQQYDKKDIELIEKKRKRFNLDLSIAEEESPGDSKIFPNQRKTAKTIVSYLDNLTIVFIGVVGQTQSGKTGTMIATIKYYMKNNIIPIENIYIITGLSDTMWCEQTKKRIPDSIKCRVFHRNDLLRPKFMDEMKNKKNTLIFMDEVHLAAKEKQTIYKCFNQVGLLDKENLYKNDIKIIQFTATPDGIYCDLNGWDNGTKIIISKPSKHYVSSKDLLDQNRVFQFKPLDYDYLTDIKKMLCEEKNTIKPHRVIKKIKKFIKRIDCSSKCEDFEKQINLCFKDSEVSNKFIEPLVKVAMMQLKILENINDIRFKIVRISKKGKLYHVIRTPNGEKNNIQSNFNKIFNQEYDYVSYDQTNKQITDLNALLEEQPTKHTFIFIKEKLRCAKTICKKYLGVFYDRYTKAPNDSTSIQGAIGRLTGYNDNGFSLCYTNIESIHKYYTILNNDFTDLSKWNSSTTNKKKIVKTFNHESHYDSDCETSEQIAITNIPIFVEEEHELRWETDHSNNAPNILFNIVPKFSIVDGRWCHFDGKLRTLESCPPLSGGGHANYHNVLVYKHSNSNEWTVRKMMYQ